jgi:hypothetical protein
MTDDIRELPHYATCFNRAMASGLSVTDMRDQAGQLQAHALRFNREASAVAAQAWFDAAEAVALGHRMEQAA